MTERRIVTAQTDELEADRLVELTALCEAAFGESFAAAWERVGPGLHVMAEVGGRMVAHAMVVDRRVYVGHETDLALDVGYVEHVATLPQASSAGHGTAAMREIGRIIADEYVLGALATGSNRFYERLGWETWRGPTHVRTPDGQRIRSSAQDGHVMVLRTNRTPPDLRLDGAIAIDWRPEEPW